MERPGSTNEIFLSAKSTYLMVVNQKISTYPLVVEIVWVTVHEPVREPRTTNERRKERRLCVFARHFSLVDYFYTLSSHVFRFYRRRLLAQNSTHNQTI